jgi:hypothetical protein
LKVGASTVWTAVLVIARWPSQPWIAEGSISTALPEQLRQPRDVDGDPSRLSWFYCYLTQFAATIRVATVRPHFRRRVTPAPRILHR